MVPLKNINNKNENIKPNVDLPPPVNIVKGKEKTKYQEVDVLKNINSTVEENKLNKDINELSKDISILQDKIKEQSNIISNFESKKTEDTTIKKQYLKSAILPALLEIIKITIPVTIVMLLFLQHEKKQLKSNILVNMINGENFKIQIALELLRDNYSTEHNQYYYKLIDHQVRNNVLNIWDWHNFSIINSYKKLDQLKQLTFSDDKANFNLENNIVGYHKVQEKDLREIYENFYDVEVNEKDNHDFTNTLREGNIFLKNKKCLDSYLKFERALSFSSQSVAAQQGRVLSFNCAYKDDSNALTTALKTQEAIKLLSR